MGLFRPKAPEGKALLLLDVESGSVGGALVYVAREAKPKLFGESREFLPVTFARSSEELLSGIEKALHKVAQHLSTLASRLRHVVEGKTEQFGRVEEVVVFLAPPWGIPDLAAGQPTFDPQAQALARTAVEARFGRLPAHFYTSGGLMSFGARSLFEPQQELLFVPHGEISELVLMGEGGVTAHATLPVGEHALIRTLRSHAGISEAEARSLLRLGYAGHSSATNELMRTAGVYVSEQVAEAVRDLLHTEALQGLKVLGREESARWFAQALASHEPLARLFPQNTAARSLRLAHLSPHIAAHEASPDLRLMLGALFVDNRLQ